MSSLLPPNSTSAERAIEAATARIGCVPTPLRNLWNPNTCPVDLLPWLAWALSVDSWRPYWPEHIKRARVRSALDIQRRKGTVASVRSIVEAFGGAVAMREWWQQSPPATPHTFELVLTLSGNGGQEASAEYVSDVIAEVSRTKPVRSHFTFIQGLQANAGIAVGGGARAAVYRRMQFDEAEE